MSEETTETETETGAPDGAPADTTKHDNPHLAEAIERRQNALRRADVAEARTALLEAENKALRAGVSTDKSKPPPTAPDGAPPWAAEMRAEIAGLKAEISGGQSTTKRKDAIASVLGRMPEGNRKQAELVILGLEAKGQIKLDTDGAADAIQAAINQHSPQLLRDASRPNAKLPPQKLAEGGIDWSGYNSITEVPKHLLGQVPDKVWLRLQGGSQQQAPLRL